MPFARLRRAARLALAMALALASPAAAQDLSWAVVAGVQAGDGLTVRAAPDAEAPALGALEPGALVVSTGETATSSVAWTRVASGELLGWVVSRFLAPAAFRTLDDAALPEAGACGGVEPFWSARRTPDALVLTVMGEPDRTLPITAVPRAEGRPFGLIDARAATGDRALLTYEESQCRETVIDAPVLGRGALILIEDGRTRWFVGCCRPRAEALETR